MAASKCTSSQRIKPLRRALLIWYRKHRRSLPWRAVGAQKPDPYFVLVCEAMLQQTQVATVVAYFERFIEAWPTVAALADADEQAVLRRWQGFGYYRRARSLHQAARQIVEQHGEQVPCDVDELMNLPGIGRYTAGAIASIAYNKPQPIVDGNVARVLARLWAIRQPIDAPRTRARLWNLAQELSQTRSPGDLNQAIMELGALICTPRKPQCSHCPVRCWCDAQAKGCAAQLPKRLKQAKPKAVTHVVMAIERRGRLLFNQRDASGLWANMWQLPTAEDMTSKHTTAQVRSWAGEQLGLHVGCFDCVGRFKHMTTHRAIEFVLWRGCAKSGRLRRGGGQWRYMNRVDDLPLAKPQQRALAMLVDAPRACGD